jgi:hypothetical protein
VPLKSTLNRLMLASHSVPFPSVTLYDSIQIKTHINARLCLLAFPLHTVVAYLKFDSPMDDRAAEALLYYHCLTGIYIIQDSI